MQKSRLSLIHSRVVQQGRWAYDLLGGADALNRPNNSGRTRFSIDFRTVHLDDVVTKRGAPNMDSACTGTHYGLLRGTDFSHIPEDVVLPYDNGSVTDGVLVFQPSMLNTPSALELIILDCKPVANIWPATKIKSRKSLLLPAAGQATRIAPYLAAKSCIRLIRSGRW